MKDWSNKERSCGKYHCGCEQWHLLYQQQCSLKEQCGAGIGMVQKENELPCKADLHGSVASLHLETYLSMQALMCPLFGLAEAGLNHSIKNLLRVLSLITCLCLLLLEPINKLKKKSTWQLILNLSSYYTIGSWHKTTKCILVWYLAPAFIEDHLHGRKKKWQNVYIFQGCMYIKATIPQSKWALFHSSLLSQTLSRFWV